jgi:hypothetical protein
MYRWSRLGTMKSFLLSIAERSIDCEVCSAFNRTVLAGTTSWGPRGGKPSWARCGSARV